MSTSNDQLMKEVGRLEGAQAQIDRRLVSIEKTVHHIDKSLSELEGGRKMALWMLAAFGTISGSVGGFLTWMWTRL